MSGRHAVIVGAGLVGSLLAIYLARRGWRVDVYERRSDPRAKGYAGGRSINLALSARGLWGLEGVGLDKHVLEHDAIRMPGRMIHPLSGSLRFQPYSHDPMDAINSVSRGGLNITLLEAAGREKGVRLVFERRCEGVDIARCAASFVPEGCGAVGAASESIEADLIVGADGAFSAVRDALRVTDRFEYSQSYLEHGYKELHIPAGAEKGAVGFAMERSALHIWPRGGSMMIALPNRDGSFTCTLFWPFEGDHSLANLRTRAEVESFFREHYADAVPLMPTLAEDYLRNPVGSLVTVRCRPWHRMSADGLRATMLIGDAAHAIVPFYGQGMNCGFEDARVLAECLDRHANLPGALCEYQSLRKPNADAIADMAVDNFVEMRDKVGRPEFLYRKKVEQAIHDVFPDRVTPQYNLVSFSTVPYVEARRRGRELDRIVDAVTAGIGPDRLPDLGEDRWREEVAKAAGRLLVASGETPIR